MHACFVVLCRPTALLVQSPAVLAVVSQISVWFVIIFAAVIAVISLSPIHNPGLLNHFLSLLLPMPVNDTW